MTLDLTPGAPEWCARVTASKVAGILGLSPWDSPLRTWHVMAGNLPADDGNNADAKARGHYLENGCLDWWLDQNPLRTEVQRQATFTIGDWAAATPDMLATDFDGETVLVDAKTAATDDHWTDTEPPAYYFASSLWQLACAPEAKRVHLAVLFGRPRLSFREYVIERDDALIAGLIDECRTFYDTVQAGQEPGLSDMACDYDVIRTVHPDIDRDGAMQGPNIEATEALARAVTIPVIFAEISSCSYSFAGLNNHFFGMRIFTIAIIVCTIISIRMSKSHRSCNVKGKIKQSITLIHEVIVSRTNKRTLVESCLI